MIGSELPTASFEPSLIRRPRATALGRNTQGVPDVRRLVEDQFHRGFPHRVWVAGQVGQTTTDAEGGLRFRLHSSSDEDPFWLPCLIASDVLPELRDLLARVHDVDVEDVVSDGRLARVGGLIRFDAVRGGVVLGVSELDPEVTARGLLEDREHGLAVVRAAGLEARQRLRTPRAALRSIAVVRGPDDPAGAAVRERLVASGYDLEVRDLPSPLHGVSAPAAVAQAIREGSLVSDVVLLLREHGRPLGLAVFDTEQVARAVVDAPVPVVTGLGGDGCVTVCDEVAFAALGTAQDAATWVLDRLADSEAALHRARDEVVTAAAQAGERARAALADHRGSVEAAAGQAAARALVTRRRRWRVALVVAAVLAVAVVLAAVLLSRAVLLAGLVLPAVALLALRWESGHVDTRGRRQMDLGNDDFARVLEKLRGIREELSATSSPEAVQRLRDAADQLVERGEALLHGTVPG